MSNFSQLFSSGSTLATDNTNNVTGYVTFAEQTSGALGTAYISTNKLTFNPSSGTLYSVSFSSTSDINFKENVKTIDNALDIVDQLRGVSFTWKDTGEKSVGVIAQETEKVLPEVVFHTKIEDEDRLTVSYGNIVGVLIEAIKELKQEVEKLKTEK